MESFKGLMITILLIGLFSVSLFSFATYFSEDNNINNTILQNEIINRSFTNIEEELEETPSIVSSQREGFFSNIPIIGEISIILYAIVGVGKVFGDVVVNIYDLTIGMIGTALGLPPIVTGIFTAIIGVSILFLAWKVFRAGT